jgi:hypothetical protein
LETNNKADDYALLQGIHLEKQRHMQTLNVVGNLKTIIRTMILGSSLHNMSLRNLIAQILLLINYFYILRINNEEADKMANKAIGKALGHVEVNGRDFSTTFP